jgi:spore coat protein H
MTLRQLCRGNVSDWNWANLRAVNWAAALIGLLGMVLMGCGQQPSLPPSAPRPPLANRPPVASKPDAERPIDQVTASTQGQRLPLYELKIAPKDLQALEQNPRSNDTRPATLIANGELYEQVKVRYRGAYARSWPKKPLKVFFNDNQPFQGQPRLNLNSGWRDPAFVRETLAYEIYAACGAPASKSRMVRVDLNGQFRGLYVEVEQPDKAFLKRLNLKGASIYKASSRSNSADERDLGPEAAYHGHYEKETQKDESYADLQQFCQELARTPDVLDFFTRRVDLKKYIDFLAATTLTQNWDGYNKNHFIVYDGKGSKKWFAVPWDLDRTLGDYWDWSFSKTDLPILLGTRQMPGVTGWNRMADRFFSHPALRAQFLDRLEELLQKEFTIEKLFPIIDGMEAQISSEASRDRQRWGGPSDLRGGVAELKRFIERRRAYLLREVPKLRRDTAVH